MPTGPKLVAALWFALLGWFAAELVKPYLPDGTQVRNMSLIAAGFGGLVGWVFMGRRAGDTIQAAYAYGLSSSVLLSFWTIGYFALETMLKRALDKRYNGAVEALLGMIDTMAEYALYVVARPDVAITLVIGGLFGGWLTEKAADRWA
ncbi:TrgA family protein [Celeribacter arenosi]|uniref:Tellurium resistance protein n=1 Tax=Celeribacter arenosi TaxID=792649 RepID=A0ABP7KH19_9RHOB